MRDFICDGTRNSKWYFNGVNYIREFDTRTGKKIRRYCKEDIKSLLCNSDIPSVVLLKKHLNNTVDS